MKVYYGLMTHPLDRQTLYLHKIQEKYMKSIKNVFKSFVVSINLSIFAPILSVGAVLSCNDYDQSCVCHTTDWFTLFCILALGVMMLF